jgi:hypothetical protein
MLLAPSHATVLDAVSRTADESKERESMPRPSLREPAVDEANVSALIAECAYYKAERRGFQPGYELDDWLAAEREVGSFAAAPKGKPRSASPKKTARRKKVAANGG